MITATDFLLKHALADVGPFAGAQTYTQKVLGYSPIAYWPLNETSGTDADNAEGTAARDGTFIRNVTTMGTSTGIGDGNTAPDFDSTNEDRVSLTAANINSAWDKDEGTVMIWHKVSGSGVWTDGTTRILIILRDDVNNQIQLEKRSTNNTFRFYHRAGGTLLTISKSSVTDTGWHHVAITWSKTADKVIAYWNGAQEGSTQTGLGTFVGPLVLTNIGAFSAGNNHVEGYLAHCALFNTPLSAPQVLALATV